MQRDVGALQKYMNLVQQTLSMKETMVEDILFNTAHPHKTTHSLLLYSEQGELIGGICFSVLGILADIDLVVVKSEYQGRGIGSLLLRKCLEWSQLQVRVAIVQAVNKAKPFYQRAGFCTTDPAWSMCLGLFMRCRDYGDFYVFSECRGKKRPLSLFRALESMLLATSDIPKAIEQLRQPRSRSVTHGTVCATAQVVYPAFFEAGRCASTQCTLGAGHSGLCSYMLTAGKRLRRLGAAISCGSTHCHAGL